MEHSQSTGAGLLLAGRYRLGETIGSGGMGRVWRAQDELLHRTVAVKELTAGLYVSADDRAVLHERTQKEARAAARISHPGVVTVHDVIEYDGRPWIVMQYVDGPSLADAARESGRDGGRIEPREAAGIGLQILGALRAAHAAGVLHRDVKPGNVLLARDGQVLLTDFGIAAIEGDSTITRTGEIVGSIDYLAPERVRGSDPGPASDLWSLGATLYTAVQGKSPFRRNSPLSTMQAVVTDEPPTPDRAGPLTPVIAALLCKDPAARPDVAETERMLRAVLEGRPTGAEAYVPTRNMPQDGGPTVAYPAAAGYPPGYQTTPVPGAGQPGPQPSGPHTAPSGPYPPPSPASGKRSRSRWRTTVTAIAVAAVLGAGIGFAAMHFPGDGNDPGPGPTASGPTADDTTGGDTAGDDTAGDDTKTPSPTGDPSDGGAVPDGYQEVDADEGFGLWVPDGWTRQTDVNTIDFSPDGGNHVLRVSIDPEPDFATPEAHMRDLEKGLAVLPDYQQLQLGPVDYRDQKQVARWEFSWTQSAKNGVPGPRHAVDQMYFDDETGAEYAIFMSGPADDWDATQKQFATALRGWQPPGSTG